MVQQTGMAEGLSYRSPVIPVGIHYTERGNPYATRILNVTDYRTTRLQHMIRNHLPSSPPDTLMRLLRHYSPEDLTAIIHSLEFTEQIFPLLKPADRKAILGRLTQVSKKNVEAGDQRIEAIDALRVLFSKTNSLDWEEAMDQGYGDYNLSSILSTNKLAEELLRVLLKEPQRFKFQIGMILAKLPSRFLPHDVMQQLKPILSDYEIGIWTTPSGWFLCPEAEENMTKSLKEGRYTVVNGCLVVKGIGKRGAFCIKTTTTQNGTFQEGTWYSPVDETTIGTIKHAFLENKDEVRIQNGTWAIMRPAYEDDTQGGDFLENVRTHLTSKPRRRQLDRKAILQQLEMQDNAL